MSLPTTDDTSHGKAVLHHRGLPVQLRVIGGFESPQYREQMLWLADELAISRRAARQAAYWRDRR